MLRSHVLQQAPRLSRQPAGLRLPHRLLSTARSSAASSSRVQIAATAAGTAVLVASAVLGASYAADAIEMDAEPGKAEWSTEGRGGRGGVGHDSTSQLFKPHVFLSVQRSFPQCSLCKGTFRLNG